MPARIWPSADVHVAIRVNDELVVERSVPGGTYLDLGEHAFGARVSALVRNTNGAGHVDANILQDNCFVATVSCEQPGCEARAEHTSGFVRCFN